MKKVMSAILVSVLLSLMLVSQAQAYTIQGVYYNFSAAPNEPALTFYWGGNENKPPLRVMADQFVFQKNERTLQDVETRIQQQVYDVIVNVVPLSQIPSDDPIRQTPPILSLSEKIVNNKLYTYEMYFAIHIYSLDDPITPQSELLFVTRFQYGQYGDITGEWW